MPLLQRSALHQEATTLIRHFEEAWEMRDPMHLTLSDMDRVLQFKLRGQIGRQRALRATTEEQVLRRVTALALTINTRPDTYLTEIRVRTLCVLRGIGVPVASAILALVFPQQYAIIDRRNWRILTGITKTSFTVPDYLRYLAHLRGLAENFGFTPQQIDVALWQKDVERTD